MTQWEIRLFGFTKEGSHPAIILSSPERCANDDLEYVNALYCSSARLNRGPKPNEMILDESDGLQWKSALKCDVIHLLKKDGFGELRGIVSPIRRRVITRKLIECLRLPL